MAGFLAALPGLLSGVGAVSSLFGGSNKSGSQTTTLTPAPWSSVGPGAERLWDEAISMILGSGAGSYTDATKSGGIISQLANLLKGGLISPSGGSYNPGLKNLMARDVEYQKGLGGELADELTGLKGKLTSPNFYVNLGGKNVGAVTGGTRSAIEQLTNLAKDVYTTKAETGSPVAADLAYFNTIWPIVQNLQGLRFGLPTTTESATYKPSLMTQLTDAGSGVQSLLDAIKNMKG